MLLLRSGVEEVEEVLGLIRMVQGEVVEELIQKEQE